MDFNKSESSSGKKTQPRTSFRNQTFTPKSNTIMKYSKTICSNQLSEEKKQKFLVERKGLNTFIKDNLDFDFEADVTFIVKNTPDSISMAKQEFKNLYVKFAKNKDASFRISFGLIFLDRKGENLVISQPFKEFCKGSMENFKNFIETKYMGLDSSEISSSNIKKITDNEFMKVLETIKNLKWVSTKSRLCLFFTETFFVNSNEKIEEMLKSLEKNLNVTFYTLFPDDDKQNEVLQEETKISITIPAMRTIQNKKINVSKIISEEIQKAACATIDFKLLEEKTKKNTLFSLNSTQPNVYSNNSLKVEQFISTSPLYLELDPKKPSFNSNDFKILEARAMTFFIVRDINIDINWANPLIQCSNINTKVWICDSPFAEGSMRYAIYMKDVFLNEKLVGKIPKTFDSNYNVSCMRRDVEATIIFGHLVHHFNERMILKFQSEDQLLLNVANVYIYEILSPDYPYKYLWVENLLEGEYKKYNNNSGWQDPSETTYNQMAQAFSHFSWQFTKGYLMIVDLQGPYGVFTDPQIHCLDFTKFGAGNFGKLGMIRFFLTHKCNKFCKALGLIHLNPEDKTEIGEDFWEKIPDFEMFKGANEDYVRLCDLCRRPYKITKKQWFNHTNNFNFKEDYCYLCLKKKEESMVDGGECQDCSKKFKYSKYWFIMKRTEKPVRCSKCRLLNREKERRELNEKTSNENC